VPKLVCPICGRSRPTSRGKNRVSDEFTPRGLLRHIHFCHPEYVDKFLKSRILEILSNCNGKFFCQLWKDLGYPDRGRLWRCLVELSETKEILMIAPKNGNHLEFREKRKRKIPYYYTRGTLFMRNS